MVKKYEPRFIVALWLAWGDEAIGTYTVNSAFNESVCLLSWRYCYVWSAEKLYAWTLARSKSVKEVLIYVPFSLTGFLFVLSLLPHFSQKKIRINRFLCLLALTARWGVALQSEKSDLGFKLQCPQQLNKLRIWYRVFVKQPGLCINVTGTAASRKQEQVMYLGQEILWTQTLLCGKILW